MNTNGPDVIWIVERVRDEQYGQSRHAIAWRKAHSEAKALATRLQTEFDQACERVYPWYENNKTIFEMREEQVLEVSTFFRITSSPHMTGCEALIEQLTAWWHQENLAWQTFVEDEVMTKMSDPPRYCRDLVRPNNAIHYECRAVSQDPAVTRAGMLLTQELNA